MRCAVPDVLAPGLRVVFCGINPGRVSAAAGAHFANPRNDFWRLLHAAGLTPRVLEPADQFEALAHGIGLTNAAYRTTKGSGDLRRADFAGSAERLERIARELRPAWLAFVGKEAYRGAFGERPELGLQERRLDETQLFVLPSTSPANAAVPWAERKRWFRELERLSEPQQRSEVRAAILRDERVLLIAYPEWANPVWVMPGGGLEPGETDEQALRREVMEETGLELKRIGAQVWEHTTAPWAWRGAVYVSHERIYLADLASGEFRLEHVEARGRWWSVADLTTTSEVVSPRHLSELLPDWLSRASGW